MTVRITVGAWGHLGSLYKCRQGNRNEVFRNVSQNTLEPNLKFTFNPKPTSFTRLERNRKFFKVFEFFDFSTSDFKVTDGKINFLNFTKRPLKILPMKISVDPYQVKSTQARPSPNGPLSKLVHFQNHFQTGPFSNWSTFKLVHF